MDWFRFRDDEGDEYRVFFAVSVNNSVPELHLSVFRPDLTFHSTVILNNIDVHVLTFIFRNMPITTDYESVDESLKIEWSDPDTMTITKKSARYGYTTAEVPCEAVVRMMMKLEEVETIMSETY